VEKGVNVSENDPKVTSVGYGGLPDREGYVTLDACIMDKFGNAGAVAFLEGYKNPISIARKVMELTDHVMLAGEGAAKFAQKLGFRKENLLTEESRQKWLEWKKNQKAKSKSGHDTIGMIALDDNGDLSGACTTSGLAWKMHGRVGDSPIIGAGLYVDNKVGGAASTGKGEECIKVCGSFLVVEMMRRGATPTEACFEAVHRIAQRHPEKPNFQIAFIALNRQGNFGAASLFKGFSYALMKAGENKLIEAEYLLEK
jgi:L-asparaginase/N4-(beta-N-acetylglucosaminyl)-L-asparaginase